MPWHVGWNVTRAAVADLALVRQPCAPSSSRKKQPDAAKRHQCETRRLRHRANASQPGAGQKVQFFLDVDIRHCARAIQIDYDSNIAGRVAVCSGEGVQVGKRGEHRRNVVLIKRPALIPIARDVTCMGRNNLAVVIGRERGTRREPVKLNRCKLGSAKAGIIKTNLQLIRAKSCQATAPIADR